MTIVTTPSIQEAFDAIEAKKIEREYSPEFISDIDLISIFKPKGIIKDNISRYSSDIKEVNEEYDKRLVKLMSIREMADSKDKAELAALIIWTASFEPIIENAQNQLRRLNRLKQLLDRKNDSDADDITHDDIIRAKSIPVESLLQFDRYDLARCIWHNDRHPSLKLYRKTNRCWCFSCNQGGDSIDVTRQMYEVDFIQAVKKLLNKQ